MDIKNTLKEMINDYKKPLIICGGFIALLIIFFIVVGIIKGLKKSYTEIEDKMKKIKKVTKKMVVELACKIEIDTIYLLKGGITNEEDTTN